MGILYDYEDVVLIRQAEKPGDPTEITVNCPTRLGWAVICVGIILRFGLSISRGDSSTDGKWCYILFWVVGKPNTRWNLLHRRLLEVCPSCSSASGISFYKPEFQQQPKPPDVFLLKFWCYYDWKGLLHDITEALCELELTIKRVKVSTAPDGRVMDLFFVTDTRNELHTQERRDEAIYHLKDVLGDAMISCEIELAGQKLLVFTGFFISSSCNHRRNLQFGIARWTPKWISCLKHLNCYNGQFPQPTSYGRFFANAKGIFEADLLVMQADGKKLVDPNKQNALSSRLKMELFCPLRVAVESRGPDTELLVANPVELCGRGRPLVFYDITLALKILKIQIFSVEIGRHMIQDREWEVYRILLDEEEGSCVSRNKIEEGVRKKLMGWY
ncbi:ACT domain-containing protein ACR10 [Vitis vinifera]|uniref:ACT domain-containing protein ACR n=1 Tax=Vitis vinifera TaxID=29760 RepID=A0A438FRI8_VITVI|nr:ACT domain-containing protein ACR10 [Vitis vinifera]